eukprot:165622_1
MAHILSAYLLIASMKRPFLHGERGPGQRVMDCVLKAERCCLDERERCHLRALKAWIGGSLREATVHFEHALLANPRDILAARCVHDTYFYIGEARERRESIARILPSYESKEDYRFRLLGMFAYALEECNEYDRAEKSASQCIGHDPTDIWGNHALVHCYEMTGRWEEGTEFLRETKTTRRFGLPICKSLKAFNDGKYNDCIDLLEPTRIHLDTLGGSHAQRDIIRLTLLESARRAKNVGLVRALECEEFRDF